MIQTLPNLLTLSRIIAIPVVVALLYLPGRIWDWMAAGIFILACVTDFLDGYFARAWQQTSSFGRVLDPIADKLLVASCLLVLVDLNSIRGISLIPALIILCREILVSGLREFLAELQVPLPVSRLAKWKTGIQMIALSCLLIGEDSWNAIPTQTVGLAGLWFAALLTLITGYDYLTAGLQHMASQEDE
ncbi:MAG: CDP-diacylglycerol--glycerol-3-phosphate 3-phosphatidyltransferase [Alphaproteobacteria bacterium]|nr:CDP-diacylglycerol--glycerol-3-phosphate 3-phosphatidyltransferase [Alphaproteobacteria bacterium]